MERQPLKTKQALKSNNGAILFAIPNFTGKCNQDSLIYDFTGEYMGKAVSGILTEYFPNDRTDMYYDLLRQPSGVIDIGYLSESNFKIGLSKFTEYYDTLFFEAGKKCADASGFNIFYANNTAYACVFADMMLERPFSFESRMDEIDFIKALADNVAEFSDHGTVMKTDIIIKADNGIFPVGIFEDDCENKKIFDLNINAFGNFLFILMFGRNPVTSDKRCFSHWNKPMNDFCRKITDDDFNILCDILRLTIQVTRQNCLKNAGELMKKLSALR